MATAAPITLKVTSRRRNPTSEWKPGRDHFVGTFSAECEQANYGSHQYGSGEEESAREVPEKSV